MRKEPRADSRRLGDDARTQREPELAELVTRDSMIGTDLPSTPLRPASQAEASRDLPR